MWLLEKMIIKAKDIYDNNPNDYNRDEVIKL